MIKAIKKRSRKQLKERQTSDLNYTIRKEDGTIFLRIEDGIVVFASKDSDFKKGDNIKE